MSDYLLIDGDKAIFSPSFGTATVIVQPGTLIASGPATVSGKKVCVAGDEKSVSVAGCSYTTTSHPIPGIGALEIASLAADQTAGKTRSGGILVMLVGSSFTARFVVQSPAQQPTSTGPVPDPTPRYAGSGSFLTMNAKFKGE
jgi:hypothetical protein